MAAVDFNGIEAAVADALGCLAYSSMRCRISSGLMATPTVPVLRSGTADGEKIVRPSRSKVVLVPP